MPEYISAPSDASFVLLLEGDEHLSGICTLEDTLKTLYTVLNPVPAVFKNSI